MQNPGYVQMTKPDKLLQEADHLSDLGVGSNVLRQQHEVAVEQLGNDVLLEASRVWLIS